MDSARQHLELWLSHNLDLAGRQFDADLDALGKEMASRGLYLSGGRVRRAISLANTCVTQIAKLAIDKAKTLPDLPDSLEMVQSAVEAFASEMIAKTDDVTREAMRGPGTDGVWREVRELQKPMASDLQRVFDLAKFDWPAGKYSPPSAASWEASAMRLSPVADATKLPSMMPVVQAMAWVVFKDEQASKDKRGALDRIRASGAMQSREIASLMQAIIDRNLPVYGLAAGVGWRPVTVDAFQDDTFTLGPSKLEAYGDLYLMRADLLALFPPSMPPDATAGLTVKVEPEERNHPEPHSARKQLSPKALEKWWNAIRKTRDSLTQVQLLELCREAHPDHSISRDRIRELTAGRKRGRKPIGGKIPAE